MLTNIIHHNKITALAAIIMALCSCSADQGVDRPVEMQLWDIVSYEGTANSEGGSIFSFRQVDDTPLITLTSGQTLSGPKAGERMMLRYIPESGKAYSSGPIKLINASKVNQGTVETEWKNEYDIWNRDRVYLYSVWRSGEYLNFHLRLTYDKEPRVFKIVTDPKTIGSEYPEIYLVHIMSAPTDYHDRGYFASFDIGPIWKRSEVKGVKVHIADTNLNKQLFTFEKKN